MTNLAKEMEELQDRGLLKGFRLLLKAGKFPNFHMFLDHAEAMRNTEYPLVRDYARSYETIRNSN